MSSETQHFSLERLDPGEDLSTDDWKFGGVDRALIDRLLYLALSGHHHTGLPVVDSVQPTMAPLLTAAVGAGSLPAGVDVNYLYSLVDGDGGEGAASPVATVTTEAAVTVPDAATLTRYATGGTLSPGQYFYAVTAFRGFDTLETPAGQAAVVNLPAVDGATQRVLITFPTLPAGADGFNIYRRSPGYPAYVYLASVDFPLTSYIDTGGVAEDCNRLAPNQNTTANSSTVTVDLPELPPDGYSWRLYRTMIPGQWAATLLATVPPLTTSYLDVGNLTLVGEPTLNVITVFQPPQVNLTSGAGEVTGALAPGNVSAFPQLVTFAFPGTLVATEGTFVWTCPFVEAIIRDVTINLGRGSTPAAFPVIVDIVTSYGTPGATPVAPDEVYVSIWADPADRPTILAGDQTDTAPVDPLVDMAALQQGDHVSVDIVQAGGSATPTDTDLLVTIRLWAQELEPDTVTFG